MRFYIRQGWTIIHLPHHGEVDKNYHGVRAWCERQFKTGDWVAKLYGMGDGARFGFKNPEDATIFSLRWL